MGTSRRGQATPLYSSHGFFIYRFIFGSNFPEMTLSWECHDQSQETNWRYCFTGPELPFFQKRKGILKIDQSVKRLRMGVAYSTHRLLLSEILNFVIDLSVNHSNSAKPIKYAEISLHWFDNKFYLFSFSEWLSQNDVHAHSGWYSVIQGFQCVSN